MEIRTVTERLNRRVVHALMSQFTSVADAINELVDNPIDYNEGQMVEVCLTFDKKRSRIIVESDGGRGMSPQDIETFLSWGEGAHHKASDIGFYGQGGKAACGFLARDLKLYAKVKGSLETYMIEDVGWADRTELKTFDLTPVNLADAPAPVKNAKKDRGHVRIELLHVNPQKRWNIDTLKKQLSSTYSTLLKSGRLRIIVDSETLRPFSIPLDSKVEIVDITALVNGISVTGWAGKVNRADLGDFPLHSGFRLISKGRLIKDGEWFGYNWQSKGALNQLVGELVVEGLTPNLNKTDYTERTNSIWAELSTEVLSQLAPLIAKLRSSVEDVKITKAEQARADAVRLELSNVIKELSGLGAEMVEVIGPGGRKKAEPSSLAVGAKEHDSTGRKNEARTPPPEDPVGTLKRVLGRVAQGNFPQIEVRSWDSHERAALDHGRLVINKAHPAYKESGGSKGYIAETAILEVLSKDPENATPTQFLDRANNLVFRYHEYQLVI